MELKTRKSNSVKLISQSLTAVVAVCAATGLMWLAGRNTLGEGVIALLYLVPIGWATARWGQVPGICAALAAALSFDFFFIPPFYTFVVGSLEGWLILIIFLAVAILIVGRIQSGLSQAQAREREAIFMYELSTALAGLQTREAVARTLANHLHQVTLSRPVQVILGLDGTSPAVNISIPEGTPAIPPDRVIPLQAAREMAGEIRFWQGGLPLPAADSRLLQTFVAQGALALERARLMQIQMQMETS
jgi:K+-sensing histidine kinase KdpD